jgi:transcriptional regulator with XRE-family HTH domain
MMNDSNYKKLLDVIKTQRQCSNKSQADMARLLNLSQTAYGKIENGKTLISFDRLDEICEILLLNMFDLLRGIYQDDTMVTISNEVVKHINSLEMNQKWFNVVKSMIYEIRGRINDVVLAPQSKDGIKLSVIEEIAVKYQDLINLVEIYEFSVIHEGMKNAD